MRFTFVTLFPEFFDSPLASGLPAKARTTGVIDCDFVNPREYATDRHHTVDDEPYGGGPGMVMKPDVLADALDTLPAGVRLIEPSPRGVPLTQALAAELATEPHVAFVCSRYEGIDERIHDHYPVTRVSVGDYVLNSGETGALVLFEAIARLVPGFMGKLASADEESFASGLLEYPHYTRPAKWIARGQDHEVPPVLLSGDHGRIATWRREQMLAATHATRPDLLDTAALTTNDLQVLRQLATTPGRAEARRAANLHIALVHAPVVTRDKNTIGATSVTNLDIHDISRLATSYGCGGVHIVTPLTDQQELAASLIAHWTKGTGAKANPHRARALARTAVRATIADAAKAVEQTTGHAPRLVATTARGVGDARNTDVNALLDAGPVLLLLGTGQGLAREALDACEATLRPIRLYAPYNHLSVRSAASIMVDRLLGEG